MGLNLAPVQKFVESLMVDACIITRDPHLTADDTWNEATGTYVPVGSQVLYSGKCMISTPKRIYPQPTEQGGAPEIEVNYFVSLPIGVVTDFWPMDKVVVTRSITKVLVGQFFTVIDVVGVSTYSADRRLLMHRLIRRPE